MIAASSVSQASSARTSPVRSSLSTSKLKVAWNAHQVSTAPVAQPSRQWYLARQENLDSRPEENHWSHATDALKVVQTLKRVAQSASFVVVVQQTAMTVRLANVLELSEHGKQVLTSVCARRATKTQH